MTNSKESADDSKPEPKKCVNPYSLASNARLLAYWQYRNSVAQPPDTWRIRHTWVDPDSPDGEATIADARKRNVDSAAPLKELRENSAQAAFAKSRYVRDIRLLSTWRLLVGQKRDGCIQLEQQLDVELQRYSQLKREYKECVNALEEFLSRDHEESMRILNLAEAQSALTAELSDRRDALSRQYGQARLEVYHWEEAWRTVRACHRFLHRVSPLAILAQEDDKSEDEAGDERATHVAADRDNLSKKPSASLVDLGHATSLASLIAAFEQEATAVSQSAAAEPSQLAFSEANDLLELFRDIELQNLNGLIHLESLNGPMADMIARIEAAEVQVNREIEDVLDDIERLEKAIGTEERRAQRLERKASRLVQRQFRALICSEEALRARVLVEEAYESCVGANEAALEPLAMARGLESAYEQLSADLDGLPRNLVAMCERDGFRQEMKANRETEEAARKFELMHRLLAALRRIMEQSKEAKRRMLMRRSLPRNKRQIKKKENSSSSARRDLHDFIGGVCAKRKDADEDSSDDD